MALQKDITTQFGDDDFASYWNVGEIHDDIRKAHVRAVLFGYRNAAARAAQHEPKSTTSINLRGPDYISNITRAQIYAAAKEVAQFSGSTDV